MLLVRGTQRPTGTMVSPTNRQAVASPDGKWQLTVWGEKGEVAWLMLESNHSDSRYRVQVWPISDAVYVLWAPDSQGFAFTDARFEDDYYILVDHLRGYLQSEVKDLTPALKSRFSSLLGKRYEILRWYVKPLVWVQRGVLLVGVDCVTAQQKAANPRYHPAQNWFRSYLVDVEHAEVIRDLDERETKSRYGIELANEKW